MTNLKNLKGLGSLALVALVGMVLTVLSSCERRPLLFLHDEGEQPIILKIPVIQLDLDLFWDYYSDYDWRAEWTYGWDDNDRKVFGDSIGYTIPDEFCLNRYFIGAMANQRHTERERFNFAGTRFIERYKFGYYDILTWSKIIPLEEAYSIELIENLDSVVAMTRMTTHSAPYYPSSFPRAFNQPEQLFAGYMQNLYVSSDYNDYDYYDPATNTYYKYVNMTLLPVTYIYLTQVRLHHNRGRIDGVSGEANLSGMARSVTLNNGVAGHEVATIHYNVLFKRNRPIQRTGELVDVAGGRLLTFGIPRQNSARLKGTDPLGYDGRHYMDVNFIFNNGMDSTFVFDVTDQVKRQYKGGVITIDLDVDTIHIPTRKGGSGFNAVVEDWEEKEYEFEM